MAVQSARNALRWSDSLISASGTERLQLPLQIGQSAFEQGAIAGILAALELLNYALKGKTKGLSIAQAGCGFSCQAWLFGCCSRSGFVLLRLHRLAFPPARHTRIIRRDDGTPAEPTNLELAKSVSEKEFRSDLFYRLNVFPIRVPSLRERREDIPLLVRYFIRHFALGMNRGIETIPSETMDALVNWHWPGNVRELENFIERSVILTDGTALRAPLAEFHAETSTSGEPSLEETEREYIIRVLRQTGGMLSGVTGAAHRLGLKRTTLQSKMQQLGITRRDYFGKKP